MTAAAIVAGRLLILPVTLKASVVAAGHRLEELVRLTVVVRRWNEWCDHQVVISLMADRTVVVVRLLLIISEGPRVRCIYEANVCVRRTRRERSNHVLMFVVRKLDRELALVFRFKGLIRVIRFAESEAPSFFGRSAQVADCANCWASAAECLSGKELLAMTTNA